jgi:hypothetical protein
MPDPVRVNDPSIGKAGEDCARRVGGAAAITAERSRMAGQVKRQGPARRSDKGQNGLPIGVTGAEAVQEHNRDTAGPAFSTEEFRHMALPNSPSGRP